MPDVFTNNGNAALDNIALFRKIAHLDLKISFKNDQGKLKSRTALKSILFVLATFRNNTTSQCNPDTRTIADLAGCSRDTVNRSLNTLIEHGILIKISSPVGSNVKNKYYFCLDMPDLIGIFEDDEHEIHNTPEGESVEEAIEIYRSHVL